ncbi:MAG: hypothetical protein ACKVX9_18835 [Blastocatellia bacterium]
MTSPEHAQPDAELVVIAYFPNSAEAGMACELLVNNGIHASLSGSNFGGLEPLLIPGGFSEIRLLVPADEAGRARELYDAFFVSPAPENLAELPPEIPEAGPEPDHD